MKRRILWHIPAVAVILLLMAVGCPFYRLTGVMCPACGTTRAWLAAIRGDLLGAFRMHPFFLLMPPFLFLLLHAEGEPLRRHFPGRYFLLFGFAAVLFIWNFLRLWYTS